jgi:hypothetical protein
MRGSFENMAGGPKRERPEHPLGTLGPFVDGSGGYWPALS